MKTIVKIVVAIVLVALCSNVSAQTTLKLAHINKSDLIVSMPEYEAAMVELQKIEQSLMDTMEELQVEYRKKLDDYTRNFDNWADLVKQTKMEELQSMQNRIQVFQENAQETMQIEQQKVFQPIIEKADKAIEDVAKEQGVTYVINGDSQILLFKAVGTLDLLPAVKAHLGIKN